MKITSRLLGLAIAASVLGGCNFLTADTVQANANTDARAYARTFHPAWANPVVQCQGVDSDGDGYVTCTVGDGNVTEAIECRVSLMFDYQRGCRAMRAAVRVTP